MATTAIAPTAMSMVRRPTPDFLLTISSGSALIFFDLLDCPPWNGKVITSRRSHPPRSARPRPGTASRGRSPAVPPSLPLVFGYASGVSIGLRGMSLPDGDYAGNRYHSESI